MQNYTEKKKKKN